MSSSTVLLEKRNYDTSQGSSSQKRQIVTAHNTVGQRFVPRGLPRSPRVISQKSSIPNLHLTLVWKEEGGWVGNVGAKSCHVVVAFRVASGDDQVRGGLSLFPRVRRPAPFPSIHSNGAVYPKTRAHSFNERLEVSSEQSAGSIHTIPIALSSALLQTATHRSSRTLQLGTDFPYSVCGSSY